VNASRLERIIFVVDGSAQMEPHLPLIANALAGLPAGVEFALLMASDTAQELTGRPQPGDDELYGTAAEALRRFRAAGGQDNMPALLRAWDYAAQREHSAVVWIHAPQPIQLQPVEPLRQRFERRPGSPRLYDMQTSNGPNRIFEKLDPTPSIKPVLRLGGVRQDLARLIASWQINSQTVEASREAVSQSLFDASSAGKQTSFHLARLWAFDEALRLIAEHNNAEAIDLAARYQLVTPVSGAVVLETKAQFDAAGLEPVDASTVPSIPEPETWALMLFALAILAPVIYRRRRKPFSPS
jgi:PEP-CTERM motif